jgi:hypothetical protein
MGTFGKLKGAFWGGSESRDSKGSTHENGS